MCLQPGMKLSQLILDIFLNDQLDAQFFFMYVYFYSLHVSGSHVPIIRRINCINTTSGICHSLQMTVWSAGLDVTAVSSKHILYQLMIVPTIADDTSYNGSRYFLHYLTILPTLVHDVSTVSHDITYTSSRQYLQQTTKVTILAHYCTYTSSRYFIQQLTILPTVSYDITSTSSRYFYSISRYNLHQLCFYSISRNNLHQNFKHMVPCIMIQC